MKVKQIAELMEKYTPARLAYDWDNVGLLVGNGENEVKKIMITLDTNLETVREAAENGCDMILSHHPIMFRGIKRLDLTSPTGKMMEILIKNDISVFAAHTNMDTAKIGINAYLAELFGLENIKILEQHTDDIEAGLGRYGDFKNEITLDELCKITKEKLNTPFVRAAGASEKKIKTLCVASGSCSECIETAIKCGCDAVITGDMKYHEMIDYSECGIAVIDAGHYPTEIIVTDIFEKILEELGNDKPQIIKSTERDIFKIY